MAGGLVVDVVTLFPDLMQKVASSLLKKAGLVPSYLSRVATTATRQVGPSLGDVHKTILERLKAGALHSKARASLGPEVTPHSLKLKAHQEGLDSLSRRQFAADASRQQGRLRFLQQRETKGPTVHLSPETLEKLRRRVSAA